jgi:hypothetical protein
MTRIEFKSFVEKSLAELKLMAEQYADHDLPEILKFQWLGESQPVHEGLENILEAITEVVYVDENNIYPIVDLHISYDGNNHSALLVKGSRANYSPRPFQKGWSGRPGPFIYAIGQPFLLSGIDHSSKEFKNRLIDMGLLHYPKES